MGTEEKTAVKCRNCDVPIRPSARGIVHENGLMRCIPWQSGKPYGSAVAEMPELTESE